MQYTIHTAKTQLSKLIEAALDGEEVIIAKGSHPVVKLVPVKTAPAFRFGVLPELAATEPDFFAPLDDEELGLWEGQG